MNIFSHLVVVSLLISFEWSVPCPQLIVSKSLIVTAARVSLTCSGRSSGKKDVILSSNLIFPSEIASPTAVAVNDLLTDHIT